MLDSRDRDRLFLGAVTSPADAPPSRGVVRAGTWGLLVLGAGGLALASALAKADVFVIAWQRGRAERVAALPDTPLILVSLIAACIVVGVFAWLRHARGKTIDDTARALAPLAWLWILVLPFLPVVADVLPALAVLAGPMRWVVVAAVAVALVWTCGGHSLGAWAARRMVGARPLVLGPVAFVLYVGVGAWVTSVQGLGGDEPHYLMIVESLLRDGDLQVENNYRNRDNLPFFNGTLRPHFMRRGLGGVIYSIHAPGLPVLILPAYAAAGRVGASLFLALVAALGGVAIFRLARALTGPGVALATWAGVTLTTPYLMHGWLIFPEMPAACIAAWALWWVWAPPPAAPWRWAWRGLVLGYLPWLHTKFSVLLAGLVLVLAWRLIRKPWALLAFAAPIAVSLVAWLYSFHVMYGVADPTIPYGGLAAQAADLRWSNVPRGVLGLLLDQEYGLLPHAPFYLWAAIGLPLVARRRAGWLLVATITLAGGGFLLGTTRYTMWWGGASVPARFAIPLLPLLAPLVAVGVQRLTSGPAGRALVATSLGASVAIAALQIARPGAYTMWNDRDGTSKLLEWMRGTVPLEHLFPSFINADWLSQLPRVAIVLACGAVAVGMAWVVSRRRGLTPDPAPHLALLLIVATVACIGVAARVTMTRVTASELARSGRLGLLGLRDGRTLVDLTSYRRQAEEALLLSLRVPLLTNPGDAPRDPARWLGPFTLSPGAYEIQVWPQGGPARAGEFSVRPWRSQAVLASAEAQPGRPAVIRLWIPGGVRMPAVWLAASDPQLAAAAGRVDLVATSLESWGERALPVLNIEAIGDRPGAYLAYLDENAFAEGGVFWTRGESATSVVIVAAGASSLRLVAQAGAAAGTARMSVDGAATTWSLSAGESRTVDVPLRAVEQVVRLDCAFTGGFRPSDVDSNSDDTRWLGLRVFVTPIH